MTRTSNVGRVLGGVKDVMLVGLVLACIPVAILLVGMPFVLLAWLVAAVSGQ